MVLGGETADAAELTPIEAALDVLSTSLDHLVKLVEDGGFDSFDNPRLLDFARSFERVRNRLPLIDHRLIADAETRQFGTRVDPAIHGPGADLGAAAIAR